MKKIFGLTLVAVSLTLVPQQASAWSNCQFGMGLNMQRQAGDNSIGKHFWHSGQVPGGPGPGPGYGYGGPVGPDAFPSQFPGAFPGQFPGAPVAYPAPNASVAFPPAPMPVAPVVPVVPTPAPAPAQQQSAESFPGNPYHYANYQHSYYYTQPVYYYGW